LNTHLQSDLHCDHLFLHMNYTFLPPVEQAHMKREYRIRILIVICFFVSVGFIVGICSLFPAYIYASLAEQTHLNQVATFKKTTDIATISAIQQELAMSKTLLTTVAGTVAPDVFYTTIRSIVSLRGSVKLTSFALEHQDAHSMTIVLSGIAPTRAELLSFQSRLQTLSHKVTAELPLSILALDTNISFSIQIHETLQ